MDQTSSSEKKSSSMLDGYSTPTTNTTKQSSQLMTKEWLESLPLEEQRKYMYDHDTGEVLDLETFQPVKVSIKLDKKKVWNDFWKDSQSRTIQFLKLCKAGELQKVQELVDTSQVLDLNVKDQNDWTALHFACSLGLIPLTTYLLSKKVSIDEQDDNLKTPLTVAVCQCNYQIASILLKANANPNLQDIQLNTPLHHAVISNYLDIINLLLQFKADPYIQNEESDNCLQLISNDPQLQIFNKFGFKKQIRSSNSERSSSQTDSASQFMKKAMDKSIKFFGVTMKTKQHTSRVSSVPIRNEDEEISTDSFNVHKELGKGSFGIVYLVSKKDTKQMYAMKVLRKEKISPKLLPYIQTEKSILGTVEHPFVVKLHYAFQNKTKLFLIMDLCTGGDMTKLLDLKNKLPEDVARMYIAEIILALEGLHQAKIMYRDLKPQNIIIDSKGHAMITDFGLAKIDSDETKSFCGTPAYMAPEVVKKMSYNRCVDWYQLGTITHEMLYGIPPYYSHDRNELFENIKNQKLKFPNGKISKEAQAFMAQLLERNPSKRLGARQDAEEIKQHPWMQHLNWEDVYNKKLPVPQPSFVNLPKEIIEVNFNDDLQENARVIDNWTFVNEM